MVFVPDADIKYSTMNEVQFVMWLSKQPGWFDYSGDASTQAAHLLPDGTMLRIGITDDDVAEQSGLWMDIYKGLQVK